MIFIYDYKKLVKRKVKNYAKFFPFSCQPLVMHERCRAILFFCVAGISEKGFFQFSFFPVLPSVLYPVFKLRCAKFIVILEQDDGPPSMA